MIPNLSQPTHLPRKNPLRDQALEVDLRVAVMACLSGGESPGRRSGNW
jgi:hypothetical protein